MYRIEDNYNWKSLEQWRNIINSKAVKCEETTEKWDENFSLELAITMLRENRFPIAIICCISNDGEKVIIENVLWKKIMDFLNNKRKIQINKKHVLFNEMEYEEREAILKAQILSMWFRK